jgi:MtN3 and saliva related transmembrane protein
MEATILIGIGASACSAFSLLPQLVKISKEKKANGLSLGMVTVLFAGLMLWIVYGILKSDYIIVASNAVSFCINTAIALLAWKYRKNK